MFFFLEIMPTRNNSCGLMVQDILQTRWHICPSSPGNLWNNPPLIATEIIPSPVVSENIVEQHTKSHEESQ